MLLASNDESFFFCAKPGVDRINKHITHVLKKEAFFIVLDFFSNVIKTIYMGLYIID